VDVLTVLEILLTAIWLMLPAYLPNSAAVVTGGGPPIDGGRMFRGDRLLGDGKTWRGTAGGILAGAVLATIMNRLLPVVEGILAVDLFSFPLAAMISLPAGALLGDMAASFIKRRSGRERGAPFPGLDQLDFVVGSLGLTAVLAWGWLARVLTLEVLAVILVVTPLLHVTVNVVGYHLGLKDEPW
jgi:CDP-2,3-bis-(O-geranylgeranyl)-sn-glycerol synthase